MIDIHVPIRVKAAAAVPRSQTYDECEVYRAQTLPFRINDQRLLLQCIE